MGYHGNHDKQSVTVYSSKYVSYFPNFIALALVVQERKVRLEEEGEREHLFPKLLERGSG